MPPAAKKTTAPRKRAATPELPPADELPADAELVDELPADEVEVPDELVFETDTSEHDARQAEPAVPFRLDGEVYRARRPKATVLISLIAATSPDASMQDQAQAVLTWIRHCLDDPSRQRLTARLYNRDDALQFEHLADVMWTMLERWDAEDRAALPRAERRAQQKPGRQQQGGQQQGRPVGGAQLAARARAARR